MMKHSRIFLLGLFLILFIAPLILSTSCIDTTENLASNESSIDSPDIMPKKTYTTSDVSNYIGWVDSWTYGYIDGYYSGQPGFSLSNLQSENGLYATLTENGVPLGVAQFDYTFSIIPTDWDTYRCHRLEIYGRCTTAPEDLEVYFTMPSGSETLAFTIDSTSNQLYSIDLPTSYSSGDILVRLVDTVQVSFESVSEWAIDHIRVRCYDYVPACESVRVDTAFDTDNLYPYKGSGSNDYYIFTAKISDGDGGNTINIVYLACQTESSTLLWEAIWSSAGGFDWPSDEPYVNRGELYEAGCSVSYSGAERTVVFAVRLFYECPEVDNADFGLLIYCSGGGSAFKVFDSIYVGGGSTQRDLDIQTALTWDFTPSTSETRCDPEDNIDFTGTAIFAASGSSVTAGYYRADISRITPTSPSWSTTQWTDTGAFAVSCPTIGEAGDVNTFQVVLRSHLGTTLLGPDSDTVTLDSVEGYDYGAVDDWINVASTTTIYTKLRYVSNSTEITGGSLTWSGISMSYDPIDRRWEGTTSTQSSPTTITYSSLIVATPEGITTVQTHSSVSVIWDNLFVESYQSFRTVDDIEDSHIGVGESLYIVLQLSYEEEGSWVTDGTFTVNGYALSYTGIDGKWRTTDISADQVGELTFNNLAVSSAPSSGITGINQNSQTITVFWNALMVDLSVEDAHVNFDDTVRIWVHVTRALDGSVLTNTSGSVILRHTLSGDILMTYSSVDSMWYADVIQSDVGAWKYYVYSISDSEEGLTVVGNGLDFDGLDDYVDCGSDSSIDITSELTLSIWFYGDCSNWDSGMYLLAKKDNNNAQYSLYIHSDGTLYFVYYNGVIREIALRTGVTRNTWHHVTVTVSGTTLNCWYDGVHVQDDYSLPVPLTSYSSVPVLIGCQKSGAGTAYHFQGYISEVIIYSAVLSDVDCELLYQGQYPEATNLRLHLTRASVDMSGLSWNDLSSSSNDGAIYQATVLCGSLPMSEDEFVNIIWDQITVVGYSSNDLTINVESASSTHVGLQYVYSGNPVVDGTVTINGLSASPSVTLGTWDFSDTKTTAQAFTYDTVIYSGGSYGLSSVDQNVQTLTQVWDEIKILTTTVVDGRINTGLQAEIRVTASLTYYSSHMLGGSDTLYMDGIKMLWSPTGYFYYRPSQSSYGTFNYAVNLTNVLEDTYEITSVNLDGNSVAVSWDTLIVSITDPIDQRINIGTNASGIIVSVIYALDSQPYDGSIILNNTLFQFSTVGRRGYSLFPFTGNDTYGITNVLINDETWCIWDSIIISMTDPSPQTLLVGQNASGIVVTVTYAYDGLPFDGTIQLNNTLFSYLTPGQRGYSVSIISGGSHNISIIGVNDETYAIWVLQQATLHLDALDTNILVSTIYDSQEFQIEVYLTNTSMNLISGWVNLTIDGKDYVVYCDGIVNSIFNFTPLVSKAYTLAAVFEGDSDYGSTETSILLTATPRDITFTTEIPTEISALTSSPFGFLGVYDHDFVGEFQGVTYIRNLPINASFSIWWTISSDYGNPRTFTGTWNITIGEGSGLVMVPWDLEGNGWLTSTDFICYFVIKLDGLGIYENITIETPVDVLHPLKVDLQIPTLTYSDQSTLNFQVHPLFDPSFTDDLDLTIRIYISDDNTTWVLIGEATTTASGWQSMNWTCLDSGTLFFKAETVRTELYTASSGFANSAVEKESTVLTIVSVGNFTYSDQGVLVALLVTDDGEPLSDQIVFLELQDGTWISIGSGLTNDSGHVSILWIPTLPADKYSIQIRVSLAGSQYFLTPTDAVGQLEVSKEFTVISIDFATAAQGFVRARVTDDDGTPIPSIQVHFYRGSNHEYRGVGVTDNDGYTRLNITLNDGDILEAVVNEDNYYYGAHQGVTVTLPFDFMFLGTVIGGVFMLAAGIAVSRKIIRGRRIPRPPKPPSADEVSKVLEKERDSIPKRVKKHSEERLAELSGTEGDSGESSEAPSIDEVESPSKTEDKIEWDIDT